MPDRTLSVALVAGLLSSGLFLVVFGMGLGFLFMFLPTVPLFYIALSGSLFTRFAVLSAAILIFLIAGTAASVLYLLFLGFPAWFMGTHLMRARDTPEGRQWYPVGLIILQLSSYACAIIALMTWYYAGEPGGLPQMMSQNIRQTFSGLEAEYGELIESLATVWAFLVFPITVWMWGMALYAHAWLANRVPAKQERQKREDLSVKGFTLPAWSLQLLAIAALASLIGSPSMAFLGKAALVSLLLPYFFLGAALLHEQVRNWPTGGRILLFFVYFAVFTQFWPALLLSAAGLYHQIRQLSGGAAK